MDILDSIITEDPELVNSNAKTNSESSTTDIPRYVIALVFLALFISVLAIAMVCVLICYVVKKRKSDSKGKPPPPAYENNGGALARPSPYEELRGGVENHMYCDVVAGSR